MNYFEPLQTITRHFLINTASTVKLATHNQILYIKAEDNYSKVYLEDKSEFLLSKTLGVVEYELNDEQFFRCHRSFLINLIHVKEICKGTERCILLDTGTKIPLARRRLCDLRKLLSEKSRSSPYSIN